MVVLYNLVVKPNFGVQHRHKKKVSAAVKGKLIVVMDIEEPPILWHILVFVALVSEIEVIAKDFG